MKTKKLVQLKAQLSRSNVFMVAILPPYAHLDEEAVQCIAQASSRYSVPELLIHAVVLTENGRTGQCTSNNANGTKDCGLAQINTSTAADLAKFGLSQELITSNACVNVQVAAYVLRKNYEIKNQSWTHAVAAYNIGPNNWTPARTAIGARYATKVIDMWWRLHRYVTEPHMRPKR